MRWSLTRMHGGICEVVVLGALCGDESNLNETPQHVAHSCYEVHRALFIARWSAADLKGIKGN